MSVGLSLLSSIIRDKDADIFNSLEPEWFQSAFELPIHAFIQDYLNKNEELPPASILIQRFAYIEPHLNIEGTCKYWKEEFTKRRFSQVYDKAINELNPIIGKGDISEAKDRLGILTSTLTYLDNEQDSPKTRIEVLSGLVDRMKDRRLAGGIVGIPTGWDILTRIIRGFVPKNLYVLAARKKIGKTQSLLYMSNSAFNMGYNVLDISMEMTEDEYANRLASLVTGIDLNLLLSGKISTPTEEALARVVQETPTNTHVFKEGFFRMGTAQIEAMIIANKPNIIFLDGAYLLRPDSTSNKLSGWERVTEIVKDLKRLAGRHNVPIVASYQFNRKEEVHLSDSISQIATAVMGMYLMPDRVNTRKIKVLDNRNGPRGEIIINFDFTNVDFSQIEGSDETHSDLTLFGEFAIPEEGG